MARNELAQRIVVAAVGIPLAVVVIYLGGWVLGAVLALIAAGAALEVYHLAERRGVRAFAWPGAAAAGALVLLATARPAAMQAAVLLWPAVVVLVLGLGVAAIWARGVDGQPLQAVATTLVGALLPGGTLSYALLLRHLPAIGTVAGAAGAESAAGRWAGTGLVLFAVGLTWINDAGAYFAGRAWGRHRLIPRVSPGKTVEGGIAGVVGAVLVGAVYAALVFDAWLGLPVGAVAGAVGGGLIAVVAQLGDLVESLYKRDAGVKDSGRILPGHGGFLDRFDALFYTLPVAYGYLALILPATAGGLSWP